MRDLIAKASDVIQAASLDDIQLHDASFGRRVRNPDDVPDDLHLEITTSYQGRLSDRLEHDFYVLASLGLEVAPTDAEATTGEELDPDEHVGADSSQSEEAIAWVQATYELHYRLPPDFEGSDEALTAFAETNGVFNAWPYFREFVQNSLTRMGLPPIFLPLFRVPRTESSESSRDARDR